MTSAWPRAVAYLLDVWDAQDIGSVVLIISALLPLCLLLPRARSTKGSATLIPTLKYLLKKKPSLDTQLGVLHDHVREHAA